MSRPYFVTGALGCIGAWVVERLLARGDVPVVFDQGGDPRRIRDLVDDEGLERVRFVRGDVTDQASVRAALEESGARHVVHLAGLQVPFCRADPAAGARVLRVPPRWTRAPRAAPLRGAKWGRELSGFRSGGHDAARIRILQRHAAGRPWASRGSLAGVVPHPLNRSTPRGP